MSKTLFTILVAVLLAFGVLLGQVSLKDSFRRGSPAPPFEVTDLAGNPLSLEALKGKAVVLNFWFIACPPCRVEIPLLNQLVEEFQGKDVVFIALAPDSAEDLRAFLEEHAFHYSIVANATPIAERFGIRGAPTHVLIDREGRFAKALFGAVVDLESELRRPIEELLAR